MPPLTRSQSASARRTVSERPAKKTRRTIPVPFWLDLFPAEITERIAAALSEFAQPGDLLHLAHTSPAQQHAVVAACLYRYELYSSTFFVLRDCVLDHEMAWASIFMREVREVVIKDEHNVLSATLCTRASFLFRVPTLRVAEISDHPELLHAIANATSLQKLTVSCANGLSHISAVRRFMESLRALHLQELYLHCSFDVSECLFDKLDDLRESPHALARCCTQLLQFTGQCSMDHEPELFWKVWSSLPNIRKAVVGESPPEWVIRRLKTIDDISMVEYHPIDIEDAKVKSTLARRLGPSVSQLYITEAGNVAEAADIGALAECTNLRELHLEVREGAEFALPGVVCAMPKLRRLTLWWPFIEQSRAVEYHFLDGVERGEILQMHEVTTGVMLRVVQQAPVLAHVEMFGVRIRASEVVAILKHMGTRLRHFGVYFRGQEEASVDRFESIVDAMCKYNHELRSVLNGLEDSVCSDLDIHWVAQCHRLTEDQAALLRERKEMLRVLMGRVKKNIPHLDADSLHDWINVVQWVDFVVVEED